MLFESTNLQNEPTLIRALVVSIIVIALLLFAKKLPELLKEIFPNMGGGGAAKFDFGLNAKKQFKDTLVSKGFGLTAGAATGAAVGLIGGGFKGLAGGLTKGAYSGLKGKKLSEIASARAAQNRKNRQIRDSESTFDGRMNSRLRDAFGLEARTAAIDRQIHDIDINDIRRIDDQIADINRDPVMEAKRRNDAIISARKAIMDKAEGEVLKKNRAVQSAKLRAEYLREHLGEVDSVTGKTIDSAMVLSHESGYKNLLKAESLKWAELNVSNDAEVARNMQIMSDEAGYIINSALLMEQAVDDAKNANVGNAARIAHLETQKQSLERDKQVYEKRKADLNRQKEKPQADENAIKK